MTWRIARGASAQILEHAAAAAPEEACGLLLGEGTRIDTALPAANVAAEPKRHFEIDPQALFAVQRAARSGGSALLGYFHSHPSGDIAPSVTDAARAAPDGRLWIIAAPGAIGAYVTGETGLHGRFRPITLKRF
ncbi:M67 family metallopeptidase [Pacificimonas flava]|uniref:M67 family metallopeptidase n=1 Tax=Pacificimonas flava TaxID=1234595 RepID=UPI00056F7CA1|nr:M67 family metallopeptidase [Pacificimonas flava]MBB5280093.1 proteasome lid subunit RPN8/RPN11 [Pacificimonas flava]